MAEEEEERFRFGASCWFLPAAAAAASAFSEAPGYRATNSGTLNLKSCYEKGEKNGF